MTLNELRYIVAVAQKRHFGHAAEACYVSQPTLSVAVKKLEEELGVGLFERGQGEVSLTAAGERIVAQAQRVLEEAGTIRQLASQSVDQLAGPLRIGAIYTVGPYLFPKLIPVLNAQARDMSLIIKEDFTANLTGQLKQGELDVVVVSLPYEEPGIITRPLYEECFSVLMRVNHPLAAHEAISVSQLEQEAVLILGEGHCFREQVKAICPRCLQHTNGEVSPQKSIEGGSLETIRYMVASGIGVSILPDSAIGGDSLRWDLLTTRPLTQGSAKRCIAMAWRKSFPRPQAVELLGESIRASNLNGVTLVEREQAVELAVG
jgi:LysR family transcriptional regulator, hydrogen peroxide-inducible genes activator